MSLPIAFITSAISYAMWFAAINCLLERRLSLSVTIVIELLLFLPNFWLTSSLTGSVSPARFLFCVALIYITTLFLHRGKWYVKLLVLSLVMLMLLLSEYLVAAMVPAEQFGSGIQDDQTGFPVPYYVIYLFCQAVLLTALVVFGRMLRQRHAGALVSALPLMFLLFPICQLLLLVSWFLPVASMHALPDPLYTCLAVLFCLASDAGLAFAMSSTAKSIELKAQNRLLEEQVLAQARYGAALRSQREQIRSMRMDIAEQMDTIRRLLQDGQHGDAMQYTQRLQQECGRDAGLIAGCGNTVVASFLYHRRAELAEAGITLDSQLSIPPQLHIAAPDLICAFGNLLDNAAEACTAPENKHISLRARFRPPYLSIVTVNPLPAAAPRKKRRIPELERGVGTVILHQLAEKYDGEYLANPVGDEYHASLILKEVPPHVTDRDL